MLNLVRAFTFFLLISPFADAGKPVEEILCFMPRLGYTHVSQENIQELRTPGSNTASVHRIVIKKGSEEETLICKELKGLKDEQKNLEVLAPLISDYETFRETQSAQFPPEYVAFASYRGASLDNGGFVLFDEASGDSVFNLMLEWVQKGYSWAGLNPLDTRNHLIYAFRNVGRAIASFHLKYGEFQEDTNTFHSILHGDLHISNIFYNLMISKTTLIDYETMAYCLKSKGNIFLDVNRLFGFSQKEIAALVREEAGKRFCESRNIYFLDGEMLQQQEKYIAQCLKILDEFFKALKDGYVQAFASAGYCCDVDHNTITKK